MAWNWTAWRTWTTQTGQTVRVVATAIVVGAGALLWYERDDPRYPTTRDEAEVRGALAERMLALIGSESPGTNVTTNAVAYYPDRDLYLTEVPAGVESMDEDYLDLWGTGGGASGIGLVSGRPYVWGITPLTTNDWMDAEWWRSNIWAGADGFGDFAYEHTNVHYVATNMLHEIGRAMSAMRWTQDMMDLTVVGATGWVYWTGHSYEETPGGFVSSNDAISAAIRMCEVADARRVPGDVVDVESVTNQALSYHGVQVHLVLSPTNHLWDAWVTERAYFAGLNVVVPSILSVDEVWECGVFEAPNASEAAYRYFDHPAAVSGVWEVVSAPMVTLEDGTTGWAQSLFKWWGRWDLGEIEAVLQLGDTEVGWQRTSLGGNVPVVVDWGFACLTNRAAFW